MPRPTISSWDEAKAMSDQPTVKQIKWADCV